MKRARIDFRCPYCRREYSAYVDVNKLPRVRTWAICSRCQTGFAISPDRVAMPNESEDGPLAGPVVERLGRKVVQTEDGGETERPRPARAGGRGEPRPPQGKPRPENPAVRRLQPPEPTEPPEPAAPPDLELDPAPRQSWLELVPTSLKGLNTPLSQGATSLLWLLYATDRSNG